MKKNIKVLLIAAILFLVAVSCNIGGKTGNQQQQEDGSAINILQNAITEISYEPISIKNIEKLTRIGHIDTSIFPENIEITSENVIFTNSEGALYKYSLKEKDQIAESIYKNSIIRDVDIANDGSFAVVAVDNGLDIVDFDHPENIGTIESVHKGEEGFYGSRKVAISKDNSKLAVLVAENGTYTLFNVDLKTKEETVLENYPEETIYDMDWNPKKDILAVCSYDAKLDIFSGDPLEKVETKQYTGKLCTLEWSHVGDKLVISTYGESFVEIYDIDTGEFSNLELKPQYDDKVKWSNDDKLIGLLNSHEGISYLTIYDFMNHSVINNKVFDIKNGKVTSFSDFVWSNDSNDEIYFSSIEQYNGLISYNFQKDEMTQTANYPSATTFLNDFYISDDSDELYTISAWAGDIFRTWNITGDKMKSVIYPPDFEPIIGYDKKNHRIAYKSGERGSYHVTIYDINQKTLEKGPDLGDEPIIYWFESDQFFSSCTNQWDGCTSKWDAGKITSSIDLSPALYSWDRRERIKVSPNKKFITFKNHNDQTGMYNINVFEMDSFKELFTIDGIASEIAYVSWNPTSDLLVTSSDDGTIRTWGLDGEQKSVSTIFQTAMFAPAWSPDGELIASLSKDGILYILRSTNMEIIYSFPYATYAFDEYYGNMPDIKWSPDGKFLYILGPNNDLNVFGIK